MSGVSSRCTWTAEPPWQTLTSMPARLLLAAATATLVTLFLCSCVSNLPALPASGGRGADEVQLESFNLHENFVPTSLAWSPDGKYIASTGTHTRLLHIWQLAERRVVKSFELPGPAGLGFHNMAWSPNGRLLALCQPYTGSIQVFDTSDWTEIGPGREAALACEKVLFSDDGTELTAWGGDLVTWRIDGWREMRRLKGAVREGKQVRLIEGGWSDGISVNDVAYVPGTKSLVIAGGQYERTGSTECDGQPGAYTARLYLLDPSERQINRSTVVHCDLRGAMTYVEHFALSPNDPIAVVVLPLQSTERVVDAIRLDDGRLDRRVLSANEAASHPSAVRFTPDGRYLVVGGYEKSKPGSVVLIDTRTRQAVHRLSLPNPHFTELAVSPLSNALAAAAGDIISVWVFNPR